MPDEETTTATAEQTTPPVETQATETPESVQETTKPHPLEPGGERWNEIYRERSEYKRKADTLQAELDRQRSQPAQPAPQPQFYSQEQLQAFVDAGKITPAQMAGQIAIQATSASEARIEQKLEERDKRRAAVSEVNSYIAKIPKLGDTSSAEFQRVSHAAYEIADETGLDVKDPRVQKRALREAFGPLDRVRNVEQAREFDRRNADTHTETGGGGGTRQPSKDPLKDVEPARMEHWKKLGYTRAEMEAEAKFIRRPLRNR